MNHGTSRLVPALPATRLKCVSVIGYLHSHLPEPSPTLPFSSEKQRPSGVGAKSDRREGGSLPFPELD